MSAVTEVAGIVKGMPEAEYHSRPELSSTEARLILDSAAKYRYKKDHPPLVNPSKKFDIGSALHSKVLGTGYEAVVIPTDLLASNGALSTTKAKEFVARARAKGLIPLKAEDFEPVAAMAEAVLANPTARAILEQPGAAETSVFAQVDGVNVRARFDFLPDQGERRRIGADVKTTRDASERGFTRSIADYGYDVQRQWYLDALNATTGPMPVGLEPELVFIAVEKEPPYLNAVYQLPTVWTEMGRVKAERARKVFAECTESGFWPGYSTEVTLVTPPTWYVYQHEEDYAA
jgi:hypothetical protein